MTVFPSHRTGPIGRMLHARPPRGSLLTASLAVLLAFAWQCATVHFNYADHWSALFYTGEAPLPHAADFQETYQFTGPGYDGQFYRAIAHDPFSERGLSGWVDAPRLRYRRVLVPLLAWFGALGKAPAIDTAYRAVVLAFVFLGAYWSSRYAVRHGRHAAFGLGFVFVPAVLVSVDRMTVDVALAALCCGWALEQKGNSRWAILALAPLARETGLLLNLAAGAQSAIGRRYREAALSAAALLPAAAWYLYVTAKTPPGAENWLFYPPFAGWMGRVLHPTAYGVEVPLRGAVTVLDYAALAGIALAVILAVRLWLADRQGAIAIAAALFAVLAMQTGRPDVWTDAYAFGRTFSPLLLLLALEALRADDGRLAVPLLLVAPRVAAQFGEQAIGIARSLTR